ncbi:hypothetical protein TWF718_005724 [Orbilia javanica]|uniref:Uncharacterized protein n=1 Tax=Orbilia javanica TaxID=47235 RepID=A0AAN8RJ52_9PEZI
MSFAGGDEEQRYLDKLRKELNERKKIVRENLEEMGYSTESQMEQLRKDIMFPLAAENSKERESAPANQERRKKSNRPK